MSEDGNSSWEDFFVAGGTLRHNSPSYVKRPADGELLQAVMDGEFCYVLTPRQMGKSSLMVRTALRLRAEGVRTAKLDLTSIGTEVTAGQWYLGLVNRIARELRLRMDVSAWWEEHDNLGVVQRFSDFLRDQVLEQIDEQIVIFVDEIDATLNIPFSDDFFAAIRAFYNARADNPAFDRLSFVLLGVATPADLIKDRTRTPFNIGRRIDLKEFSHDDAGVLREGMVACYSQQGHEIFDRIFYWTNGHPYLTQRLCLSAVEQDSVEDGAQWVDQEVDKLFLAEAARRETNLQFIRDYIGRFPPEQQRKLLDIYDQVHRGQSVADDERSVPQSQLKLVGLVKDEAGSLVVRNEIYSHVFDQEWIKETRPVDWNRRIAIIAVIAVIFLAGIVIALIYRNSQEPEVVVKPTDQLIEEQEAVFRDGGPTSRLLALVELFDRDEPQTIESAWNLMAEIPVEERIAVFTDSEGFDNLVPRAMLPLTLVMRNSTEDNELLSAMAEVLRQVEPNDDNLAEGISDWLDGRQQAEQKRWSSADSKLIDANRNLRGHPIVYYELALVNSMEGSERSYDKALSDMNKIVIKDDLNPDISQQLVNSSAALLQQDVLDLFLDEPNLRAHLWQNPDQYPELSALVTPPTATPTPIPTATEFPPGAPTSTPAEIPAPAAAPTLAPSPTDAPDMTATFLADCTKEFEVEEYYTYRPSQTFYTLVNRPFPIHWRLRYTGTCPWPSGLRWEFVSGEDFGYTGDPSLAPEVSPEGLIMVDTPYLFTAPATARDYESTWQFVDNDENPFGSTQTFRFRILPVTSTPAPTQTPAIIVQPTSPPSSGGGGGSNPTAKPPEPPKPPTPSP